MTPTQRRNLFMLAATTGVAGALLLHKWQNDRPRADAAENESAEDKVQPIKLPLKFDPVRTQGDFRLTLLGVSKDVALTENVPGEPGSDRPGKYVTPTLSFKFLWEYLGDGSLNDAIGDNWGGSHFEVFATDGRRLVGKRTDGGVKQNQVDRHPGSGGGTAHIALDFQNLPLRLDPAPVPELDDPDKGKVLIVWEFGDALDVHQARVVYSMGPKDDRMKFVFDNVPIP